MRAGLWRERVGRTSVLTFHSQVSPPVLSHFDLVIDLSPPPLTSPLLPVNFLVALKQTICLSHHLRGQLDPHVQSLHLRRGTQPLVLGRVFGAAEGQPERDTCTMHVLTIIVSHLLRLLFLLFLVSLTARLIVSREEWRERGLRFSLFSKLVVFWWPHWWHTYLSFWGALNLNSIDLLHSPSSSSSSSSPST